MHGTAQSVRWVVMKGDPSPHLFMTVTSKRALTNYCESFRKSCVVAMLLKHMRFHAIMMKRTGVHNWRSCATFCPVRTDECRCM